MAASLGAELIAGAAGGTKVKTQVGGDSRPVGVAFLGEPALPGSHSLPARLSRCSLQRALAAESLADWRGRKERVTAPLAPAAAMKAVVQRVTRASVTGQSGGAGPGGAASDPAPGVVWPPPPGAPQRVIPAAARALRQLGPGSRKSQSGTGQLRPRAWRAPARPCLWELALGS